MENEIEKNLELFSYIIDRINDALLVIDPETSTFLYVNTKACKNLGYSKKELTNLGVVDIEAIVPNNFSWKKLANEIKQKGFILIEGAHKRKNGTTFPVEVNANYIPTKQGEYIVAIVRDISERKKAEQRLTEKNEELERFNKITIGREVKMVELKEKIKQLEKKIKKSK